MSEPQRMARKESEANTPEERRKTEEGAKGMKANNRGMFLPPVQVTAGFSRPPLARMLRLHELLAANRYPNCRKMADEFEVSPKTVQRDINFMRDRLGLPIDYDEALFGFRYTRPVQSFPPNLGAALENEEGAPGADQPPALSAPLPGKRPGRMGRVVVRIQFDAKAAPAIQERQWHPAQEITVLGDGRIELSMRLDSFAGIEPWILSWGAHACVIEPDRLRRKILRIARAIVARS